MPNFKFLKRQLKSFLILPAIFLFAPFFYLAILLKKIFAGRKKPENILIIDNAKIGDLICATPVFRAIKEKYPNARLTALVTPRVEGILQNNKHLGEIMVSNLNVSKRAKDVWKLMREIKKGNFDVSINLSPGTLNFVAPFFSLIPRRITTANGNLEFFQKILAYLSTDRLMFEKNTLSVRHYLDLLKFIEINDGNLKKEVFTDEFSDKKAAEFFKNNKISPEDVVVGMCLSAGNKIKEWSIGNFGCLADELTNRHGCKIIFTGGPADEQALEKIRQMTIPGIIITCKDFSLKEIPSLFKRFNYFISVDTGPLYIANALGIPVVDILGPCSSLDQPPVYEKCEVVYVGGLSCWPCSTVIKPATKCVLGHLKCVKEISPEIVLESFKKLLDKYPANLT